MSSKEAFLCLNSKNLDISGEDFLNRMVLTDYTTLNERLSTSRSLTFSSRAFLIESDDLDNEIRN